MLGDNAKIRRLRRSGCTRFQCEQLLNLRLLWRNEFFRQDTDLALFSTEEMNRLRVARAERQRGHLPS